MRTLLLIGLLAISTLSIHAQNIEVITHLKEKLNTSNPSEKYQILNDLAWNYRSSYPDSAIHYGKQAFLIGQKLKKKDIGRSLNFIGLAYFHKNDLLAAYDYFQQALELANQHQDSLQLGHANNNIGRLLIEQGLPERADPYLKKSQSIFELIRDSSGLAYNYQSLAVLNQLMKKNEEARHNLLHAYRIRLANQQQSEIISALLQLGKFEINNDQINPAKNYLLQADSIAHITEDNLMLSETKIRLAECMMLLGNLKEAEKMANEGLLQIRKTGNERLLPETYLILGKIYQKNNQLSLAQHYLSLTLSTSTTRKDLHNKLEAYFLIWQVAQMGNSPINELQAYKNYITLKDSLDNLEKNQEKEKWKFQLQLERRDAELASLTLRGQQKTKTIYLLLIIIIFIAISLYLLIKTKHRILKVNHLLEDRNAQIKQINNHLEKKQSILENHLATLTEFSKDHNIISGNLLEAAKTIVSVTAKKLQISQVSIWLYNETDQQIEALTCYNLRLDTFLTPEPLKFRDYPRYFESIKSQKLIIANEARINESTLEFTDTYFTQYDIYSLLDVTFLLDGKLKGLLCCEQQQIIRNWSPEDILFACAVTDIITLSFRTAERLKFETKIQEQKKKIEIMNIDLEQRVKERTAELEEQNEKLAEYAFINSHLLRGPVSRILGLIHLINLEGRTSEEILPLLKKSGEELDEIVKKISDALNSGKYISIKDLR